VSKLSIHCCEVMARFFLIMLLALATTAHGQVMSVHAEPPDWYKVLNNDKSWNIILDGVIDREAPARVAEALRKAGSDGADVIINSAGGNLVAGIQIGRVIRQAGANTRIGTLALNTRDPFGGARGVEHRLGNCLSACALAFLGGVYRFANEGSKFGVHRFSSTSAPTTADLDVGQVISAAIVAYIREMDVDPELFDLMVGSGKDEISILSAADLRRLNVINDGRKRPDWTIEVVEGFQYLRGVQDTMYGRGKAVLLCYRRTLDFYSFYLAGIKSKSLASGNWKHSLLVNGRSMALPAPTKATATNGELFAHFVLSREQAAAIAASSSMGHAMQLGRDAPTFFGYQIDIPSSSATRVSTFIRNCIAN